MAPESCLKTAIFAACADYRCPYLTRLQTNATVLINGDSNNFYVYVAGNFTYDGAQIRCSTMQPLPGAITEGYPVVYNTYSEQKLVEDHFSTTQSPLINYWIGLRQPSLGADPYDINAFEWEDESTKPSLSPSNLAALDSSGWSHWGWYSPNPDPEPNNAQGLNQQCVVAQDPAAGLHFRFYYYTGTSSTADRKTQSNYVTNVAGYNVRAWNDQPCTSSVALICEFSGGLHRQLLSSGL